MIKAQSQFVGLKKNISNSKKLLTELTNVHSELRRAQDPGEKSMINAQITTLNARLKKENDDFGKTVQGLSLTRSLHEPSTMKMPKLPKMPGAYTPTHKPEIHVKKEINPVKKEDEKEHPQIKVRQTITELDRFILERLKKKEEKVVKKKEKKASSYVRLANKMFSGTSKSILDKGGLKNLKRDLVKANMQFLARSYLSVIFFTTFVSIFISLLVFSFFLFFNFGIRFPFITPVETSIIARMLSTFWILIVFPLITFVIMFLYPSMEKKSIETKINRELPFATIHMSAISESMVEPTNIFKIIISTKEYPVIQQEFTKLLNEINVLGHDLVTALRNSAYNSPSKKLAELYDGLATTITSGGDLSDFFDKRAQSLLFDYKLDKEKQTKAAETFMDIYISVVIAAPMILMLLLIMMRVSGLGIALSTTMITIIMVLGVSIINVIFLVFLQVKQSAE